MRSSGGKVNRKLREAKSQVFAKPEKTTLKVKCYGYFQALFALVSFQAVFSFIASKELGTQFS
jgi:hypothetical protein